MKPPACETQHVWPASAPSCSTHRLGGGSFNTETLCIRSRQLVCESRVSFLFKQQGQLALKPFRPEHTHTQTHTQTHTSTSSSSSPLCYDNSSWDQCLNLPSVVGSRSKSSCRGGVKHCRKRARWVLSEPGGQSRPALRIMGRWTGL